MPHPTEIYEEPFEEGFMPYRFEEWNEGIPDPLMHAVRQSNTAALDSGYIPKEYWTWHGIEANRNEAPRAPPHDSCATPPKGAPAPRLVWQRLLGFAIFTASLLGLAYGRIATELPAQSAYLVHALSAFVVMGLGIALFRMDRAKLQREHGVDRIQGWAHLPPVWRGIVVLMFFAVFGYWYIATEAR